MVVVVVGSGLGVVGVLCFVLINVFSSGGVSELCYFPAELEGGRFSFPRPAERGQRRGLQVSFLVFLMWFCACVPRWAINIIFSC